MFISTVRKALAVGTAASSASTGNGQSVIGRMRPAFTPLARASTTALRATRALAPKATTTTSASSTRNVSARCSSRSMTA